MPPGIPSVTTLEKKSTSDIDRLIKHIEAAHPGLYSFERCLPAKHKASTRTQSEPPSSPPSSPPATKCPTCSTICHWTQRTCFACHPQEEKLKIRHCYNAIHPRLSAIEQKLMLMILTASAFAQNAEDTKITLTSTISTLIDFNEGSSDDLDTIIEED
ncbi:hypothetical protein CPB83DRAFT_900123 [Crepidotus variabilis]|uniref:Uncharacterized protein n=1 Tax=Crepidotus variabilis TaxID=179855 RepID=A0A9P6JI72_9AGAR|nr:hypothetical protein CPB83DRAFT_900123 [Crepidotus variabilis]